MFLKTIAAGALAVAMPVQYAMPDYVPVPPRGMTLCDEQRGVCIARYSELMELRLKLGLADNLIRAQEKLIEAQKADIEKNVKKCAALIPERRT